MSREIIARGGEDRRWAVVRYVQDPRNPVCWDYDTIISWWLRADMAMIAVTQYNAIAVPTWQRDWASMLLIRWAPFRLRASIYEIPWRLDDRE